MPAIRCTPSSGTSARSKRLRRLRWRITRCSTSSRRCSRRTVRARERWLCCSSFRQRLVSTEIYRLASSSSKCRWEADIVLKRLLLVAYFIEVGLLLVLVPWSQFWERNYFLTAYPALHDIIRNNYVRGAVSGL